MGSNRYTIYYTDVTFEIIKKLETEGHNQRNVINSGIVLFDQADDKARGIAYMEAYNKPRQRLRHAIQAIGSIEAGYLSESEARILKQLRACLSAAAAAEPTGRPPADPPDGRRSSEKSGAKASSENDRRREKSAR